MNIPRGIIVLFTAFALTGFGIAQDKAPKKKLKLVPGRPVLQFQQEFKQIVFPELKPVLLPNAVFTNELTIQYFRGFDAPGNPLMQGAYKTALQVFDRLRAGLSMPKDSRTARGILDDLDLKLIEVRRALWKAERRANGAKDSNRVFFHSLTAFPGVEALTFEKMMFIGGFNARQIINIDGKWVVDDGTNPFLRGDYRSAVVALTKTRTSLTSVGDPRAARRIVDTLDRMLLDVRRELWKIEQAQKKK